ncbi:MAG: hypothetical protein LBT11_04525 [Treponema sp.]|jgi:hypothetical protein|nr:hypothetical protein [Treponema sp.]
MDMFWLAVTLVLVGLPAIILSFAYKTGKDKRQREVEKLAIQKELMALEVEKEKAQLLRLEAENQHYDKLLEESR